MASLAILNCPFHLSDLREMQERAKRPLFFIRLSLYSTGDM